MKLIKAFVVEDWIGNTRLLFFMLSCSSGSLLSPVGFTWLKMLLEECIIKKENT